MKLLPKIYARIKGCVSLVTLCQVAIIAAIIIIWESWVESGGAIALFFFSKPSIIAGALIEWFAGGPIGGSVGGYVFAYTIYEHLSVTLLELLYGLLVSIGIGIALGIIMGLSKTINRIIDPFIMAFYALPRITLAPLLILWFGLGLLSKVVFIWMLCFVILAINTYYGVTSVDIRLRNQFDVLGATRWQRTLKLTIPWSLPWILSAVKVAVSLALSGVIVAEYIAASIGLGYVINRATGMQDTNTIYAGLVILMVIGIILNAAMKSIEARVLKWKPTKEI